MQGNFKLTVFDHFCEANCITDMEFESEEQAWEFGRDSVSEYISQDDPCQPHGYTIIVKNTEEDSEDREVYNA